MTRSAVVQPIPLAFTVPELKKDEKNENNIKIGNIKEMKKLAPKQLSFFDSATTKCVKEQAREKAFELIKQYLDLKGILRVSGEEDILRLIQYVQSALNNGGGEINFNDGLFGNLNSIEKAIFFKLIPYLEIICTHRKSLFNSKINFSAYFCCLGERYHKDYKVNLNAENYTSTAEKLICDVKADHMIRQLKAVESFVLESPAIKNSLVKQGVIPENHPLINVVVIDPQLNEMVRKLETTPHKVDFTENCGVMRQVTTKAKHQYYSLREFLSAYPNMNDLLGYYATKTLDASWTQADVKTIGKHKNYFLSPDSVDELEKARKRPPHGGLAPANLLQE